MEVVSILLVAAVCVTGAVVTALKGKPWCLVGGLFTGWFWVVGALRLAKPDSWWGRRFYAGTKLAESKIRFHEDRSFDAAPLYDPLRF